MANTFRGKAQVVGTAFTADVILYPIAQSLKVNQNIEEDIVKDQQGDDYAIRDHNEKYEGDVGMVLVDQSVSSTAANAKAGGAFFAPLSVVTISGCDLALWNAAWQIMSGSDIDLQNTATGKIAFKLRRWANSAQNTLLNTTPG